MKSSPSPAAGGLQNPTYQAFKASHRTRQLLRCGGAGGDTQNQNDGEGFDAGGYFHQEDPSGMTLTLPRSSPKKNLLEQPPSTVGNTNDMKHHWTATTQNPHPTTTAFTTAATTTMKRQAAAFRLPAHRGGGGGGAFGTQQQQQHQNWPRTPRTPRRGTVAVAASDFISTTSTFSKTSLAFAFRGPPPPPSESLQRRIAAYQRAVAESNGNLSSSTSTKLID
jgi:hypothetical protein